MREKLIKMIDDPYMADQILELLRESVPVVMVKNNQYMKIYFDDG